MHYQISFNQTMSAFLFTFGLVGLSIFSLNMISEKNSSIRKSSEILAKKEFHWNLQCGETYFQPKFSHHHMMKRIVGGEDAVHHSWPFLASIRIMVNNVSEHHCGGTIVSDKHILTAAHCILAYIQLAAMLDMNMIELMHLIKVNVGIDDHTMTPQNEFEVEDLEFHEEFGFTETTLTNDLMILTLKRKIRLDNPEVNIACLPPYGSDENKVGKRVVAIGWGSYALDFEHKYHNHIQQALFKILDPDDLRCNNDEMGLDNTWDKENLLCATGRRRVTCFGDSGGPVLELRNNQQWTMVGVISFGNDIRDAGSNLKKCNPSKPFYVVNVGKYLDWINSKIIS